MNRNHNQNERMETVPKLGVAALVVVLIAVGTATGLVAGAAVAIAVFTK